MPSRPVVTAVLSIALVLLGAAAAGCARAAAPVAYADPEGSWHEVQTPHFILETDLADEDAVRAGHQLEALRAALTGTLGMAPKSMRRIHLIVLANELDWGGYFPAAVNPLRLSVTNERRLVVFASAVFADPAPLLHELSHDLLSPALARQPRWFGEGLALYVETLQLGADGTFVTGRRHPLLHREVAGFAPHALHELWAWDRRRTDPDADLALEASAWAWTGYLFTEHPGRLLEFVRRLTLAEPPPLAWSAAFEGITQRALDVGVRAFVQGGDALLRHPLPEIAGRSVQRRRLDAARVALLHADLELMAATGESAPQRVADALGYLEAAKSSPATRVRAAVLRASLEGELGRTLKLRELLVANPTDPTAARAVASSLMAERAPVEEQRAAFLRALELDPKSAPALNNLAWIEVNAGRPQAAFEPAQQAVALEPASSTYLDTWAAVLFALGECRNAAEVQARAVEVLPDNATAEYRARFLSTLESYEQRCSAPASGR